jgi:L,D-peptidoglycan transpeptidase YkuD (ErfK/YbiS/YcfS/YnhG family)
MGQRTALGAVAALLLAAACSPSTTAGGPDEAPRPATPAASPTGSPAAERPGWADQLPSRTRQVIHTVSSDTWCQEVFCTVTRAWEKRDGDWELVREFPSTVGPKGWGKRRQDDGRTPEGVFEIKVTFSTTARSPGRMPWRRRLPTSNVTDYDGPLYNTWVEEDWRTDGDRPSMRWGFVVDYNFVRLQTGVGPAPVPGKGSGIFYHTTRPGRPFEPSEGCTRVSEPSDMRWLLTWLRPAAHPRVVQNR